MRDPFSSISHAAAVLFSVVITIEMVHRARRRNIRWWPFVVFGLGMFLCYLASTVFHWFNGPTDRLRFFQLLDQSAIYLLIAGTNTPVLWFLMGPTPYRNYLLSITWLLAITGIALKWSLPTLPYWAVVTPYIVLGWVALIPMPVLWRAVGSWRFAWLASGGILYTVGAMVDLLATQRLPGEMFGAHEIFHVFVIGGTACHAFFIRQYVLPFQVSLKTSKNLEIKSVPL